MLPTVISDCMIVTFKYWQGDVKVGMHYQNELFTHVRSYEPAKRLQAYDDACELSEQDLHVCLTASEQGYRLWKNLKSYDSRHDSMTKKAVAVR